MKLRLAAGGLLLAQRTHPSTALAAATGSSSYAAGRAASKGYSFPLSERLRDAVELCCERGENGGLIADVGCDHGHLAAELVSRGRDVIAVDIADAPLTNARNHFASRRLTPRGFVLCDGLPDDVECDTAVVAGLGALTAIKMMRSAKNPPKRWIIQPVPQFITKIRGLRRELVDQGYSSVKEVWRDDNSVGNPDDGRFIVTILAEQQILTNDERSELELLVGRRRDSTDATKDARLAYVTHHRDWLASIVNVDSFPQTPKANRLRTWHSLLDGEVARCRTP